jgi:hypothetical protein
LAATIRSFNSRSVKRGGSVDMSKPVLCDSQAPTASRGTPSIKRSRIRFASASVSPTITCVDQMMPTFEGSRPSASRAASISARCFAIAGIGLRAPKT